MAISEEFVRKTTKTVFWALLLDILSFTIVLPLLPRLLQHYDVTEGKDPNSLFYQMMQWITRFGQMLTVSSSNRWDIVLFGGLVGSIFSFCQFLVSPLIGAFSDKYGRKKTLMIAMMGNLLSTFLWIFAGSFKLFLASRIIGGLSEGNVQLSLAMISDITPPEKRSKGMALIGIAFAIGFTFGPPLGAYISQISLPSTWTTAFPSLYPYSSSAILAFVLLVLEMFYLLRLPETLGYRQKSSGQDNQIASPEIAKMDKSAVATESRLKKLSLIHLLFVILFSGMEFSLGFLCLDRFEFTNAQQGKMFAFIGLLSSMLQGGYVRRVAHVKVSETKLTLQGLLSCGFALIIIGRLAIGHGGVKWLYVGAALLAFTSATVVNCLNAIVSLTCANQQGSSNQGAVLGRFRSVGQLGRAIGPIFACSLYWTLGSVKAYTFGGLAMLVLYYMAKKMLPEVGIIKKLKD